MLHEREAFLGQLKMRVKYKILKDYASLLYHMRTSDPNAVVDDEITQGAIQWT